MSPPTLLPTRGLLRASALDFINSPSDCLRLLMAACSVSFLPLVPCTGTGNGSTAGSRGSATSNRQQSGRTYLCYIEDVCNLAIAATYRSLQCHQRLLRPVLTSYIEIQQS